MMFLKRNKEKNGRTHLSITQSYRNSKGKSSNKTVKTLGYLDNLSKQWNMSEQDVLDKCKSICDQMTKEYNEAKVPVYIEVKPGLRVDNWSWCKVCCFLVKKIWCKSKKGKAKNNWKSIWVGTK